MYRYTAGLVFVTAWLGLAIPVSAAQQAARNPQNKKVWTNNDLTELRARGQLSLVGPEETQATPTQASAPAATAGPVFADRFEDPAWYTDQAAGLQRQLNAQQEQLEQEQDALTQATDLRATTGGVDMAAGSALGVTPEDTIAALQQRVRQTQDRFDELADLARQNDIAPGVLRAAADSVTTPALPATAPVTSGGIPPPSEETLSSGVVPATGDRKIGRDRQEPLAVQRMFPYAKPNRNSATASADALSRRSSSSAGHSRGPSRS